MVGTVTPSVSAPPPAGLDTDLLEQDDLRVVPGEVGVQVVRERGGHAGDGRARRTLPVVHAWSYPRAADVVGWQPVLGDLAGGAPAAGTVTAGTVYAGYAPAGSFALSLDGRAVRQQPAFGWAAQYAVARGGASLALSQFPYVPLAVLLELAGVGGPGGRSGRPAATGHPGGRAGAMSPAHHSPERRWPVLALVVVVVAGVGIAGTRGAPAPLGASTAPSALVGAPDAESSAWYCTGQSTASGRVAGLPRPHQHVGELPSTGRSPRSPTPAPRNGRAVAVPAHGVVAPSVPALSSGSWESQTVILSGGGVAVTQAVHGSSGWSQAPCQSTTSSTWYFPGGTTVDSDALYLSLLNPTSTPGRGRPQLHDARRAPSIPSTTRGSCCRPARSRWRTSRPRCRTWPR